MSTLVSQILAQSGEELTSNRAQTSPDYLALYSDCARMIETVRGGGYRLAARQMSAGADARP